MRPRFFVPDLDPDRGEALLSRDEAHHLTRVLRLQAGDEVGVFDGRGREFLGRIVSTSGGAARISLIEPLAATAPPAVALTLVQAILKGDAMDQVVRDMTMTGVEAIQPVVSARTTVKTALLSRGLERWRRIALASAKQCGRSRLPTLKEAVPFTDWLERRGTDPAFLLAEPSLAREAVTVRQLVMKPIPATASIVVGPEGGWTPEEYASARERGCVPLTLGRLTLRADAAPLAAVAALLGIWNE